MKYLLKIINILSILYYSVFSDKINVKDIYYPIKILGRINMALKRFLIEGNICGDRIRLGRAMQKPPMRQEDLARVINLMGMEITPLIISRIEKNQRHVCDAELRMIAKALGVTMEWLCGDSEG